MKALWILAAVSTLAHAECTVTERPGQSKLVTCTPEQVVEPTIRHTYSYVTTAPVGGRGYNSLTVAPSGGSGTSSASEALARDAYKDVGGYHPGMQLYRGSNGSFSWYK